MANPHSAWRIELARQLAKELIPFDGIHAIVVAGSVARDFADEYSDIEVPIFWDHLPSDDTRKSIVQALKAEFLSGYDGPSNEDQLLLAGVQMDLWHITVAHQEDVIEGVLTTHRTDLESLNALDTIRCCVPLYGDVLVARWKAQAHEYPPEVAGSIIQDRLRSFRLDQLSVCAERNDPSGFYSELTHLQREAFLVLLALNRSYFPTFKWLHQCLATLPRKPKSIIGVFRDAFSKPPSEATADMHSVLQDTIQLVQESYPELDTAPALRRLGYRRQATRGPGTP